MVSAIAVSWGGLPGAVPHREPLSGGVSAGEGSAFLSRMVHCVTEIGSEPLNTSAVLRSRHSVFGAGDMGDLSTQHVHQIRES